MALTHAVDKHVVQLDPARGLFVGGVWRAAATTFDVEDPGTGEVVAAVSDATPVEAGQAVDAAYAAGGGVARHIAAAALGRPASDVRADAGGHGPARPS